MSTLGERTRRQPAIRLGANAIRLGLSYGATALGIRLLGVLGFSRALAGVGYSPMLDELSDVLTLSAMVLPYTLAVCAVAVFARRRFAVSVLAASNPLLEVLCAAAITVMGLYLLPEVLDAGPLWGFAYLAPLPILGLGCLYISRALGRWKWPAGAVSALTFAAGAAALVLSLKGRTGDWVVLWLLSVLDIEVMALAVVPLTLLAAWYIGEALARRRDGTVEGTVE